MSTKPPGPRPPRPRLLSLIWFSSALSALLLALGVSGTLSSWTQAVVNTDGNTAGTAGSPVLRVSGPDSSGSATSCTSTSATDNDYTCTSMNLYGNGGVAQMDMEPGDSHTTVTTLSNIGTVNGTTLRVAPGPCSGSAALCEALRITVACTGVGAAVGTIGPMSLSAFATADRDLLGGLVAGGPATTCTVTLSMPLLASAATADKTVTQDVAWTLTV